MARAPWRKHFGIAFDAAISAMVVQAPIRMVSSLRSFTVIWIPRRELMSPRSISVSGWQRPSAIYTHASVPPARIIPCEESRRFAASSTLLGLRYLIRSPLHPFRSMTTGESHGVICDAKLLQFSRSRNTFRIPASQAVVLIEHGLEFLLFYH